MKTIIKKIYASLDTVEKSFNKVRKELARAGLLVAGSRMDDVKCWHERLSMGGFAGFEGKMGFYDFEDRDIHIPAVFPVGLLPWYQNRQMLDVIRHEFGHALADRYKKFFRGRIFKEVFGASYGEWTVFDGGDWTDSYVSEYATTDTREDFAETFMLYLKYSGKLPGRYRGKRIVERKWKTVSRILRAIAAEISRKV